jgi:hypothetical protein
VLRDPPPKKRSAGKSIIIILLVCMDWADGIRVFGEMVYALIWGRKICIESKKFKAGFIDN